MKVDIFIYVHYSVSCIIVFLHSTGSARFIDDLANFLLFFYFELDSLFIIDCANFSWQSQISSLNVKLHSSYNLMPGARVKITKLQNNST